MLQLVEREHFLVDQVIPPDRKGLSFNALEHVLIAKVSQLSRNML